MEESGGYDYDVVDEGVYDEFYCPICTKLKRNAVELECEHSLCSNCLDQWQEKAEEMNLEFNCPECRKPINRTEVSRSGGINRMIKTSIRVKCKNTSQGCTWIGVIADVEEHFLKKCDYVIIPCTNEGCPENSLRVSLKNHLSDCVYQRILCEYCAAPTCIVDSQNHFLTCNMFPVSCGNKGCTETKSRESIAFHQSIECKYQLMDCQYSSVGCHVKFLSWESKEHENHFMAAHMALLLKNTISLQRELNDTKQILQYSTDFEINFFLKSIRLKFEVDLVNLENTVEEFSLKTGSFNMEVADYLSNPPNQHHQVLEMYLHLHYTACDILSSYQVKELKGVRENLQEVASTYKLTTDHTEFLYKNGIETGCKDLEQKYEKLCGTHKTAQTYINEVLSSVDILTNCVEQSLNRVNSQYFASKYRVDIFYEEFLCNSNHFKIRMFKDIQRSTRKSINRNIKEFIIGPNFLPVVVVLRPLWKVGVKLELEKEDANSFLFTFPVQQLVNDGFADYNGRLFLVFKKDIRN